MSRLKANFLILLSLLVTLWEVSAQANLNEVIEVGELNRICPPDWSRHGRLCYQSYHYGTSWSEAALMCLLQGAYLVDIQGYAQNQLIARIVANSSDSSSVYIEHLFWSGFHGSYNNYSWADGSQGLALEGFWSHYEENAEDQCAAVDWANPSHEWFLGDCSQALSYVCQMPACFKDDFRCADGNCIPSSHRCNGIAECDDLSDEFMCPGTCTERLEGQSGTIENPNYPENYPNQASCMWQVHAPMGTRIWFQVEDLDLEKKYDYLLVYKDGIISEEKRRRKYTGSRSQLKPITLPNHRAVFVFDSDKTVNGRGFRIHWEAHDHACKSESRLWASWVEQDLYSPGYQTDEPYPEDATCVWLVSISFASNGNKGDASDDSDENQGQGLAGSDPQAGGSCVHPDVDINNGWNNVITLQFKDFEFEDSKDTLTVYNSRGTTEKVFGVFSGSDVPRTLITNGNHMRIVLNSDSANSLRGFHATYRRGCDNVEINDRCGIVASPGYGAAVAYKARVECSWKLSHPNDQPITIIFDDFKLRPTDHICIFNGKTRESKVLLPEHNGGVKGEELPQPLRSEEGHLYMVFYSDDNKKSRGFEARFSEDCPALDLSEGVVLSTESRQYGTEVTFSCSDGYELDQPGYTNVTCEFCGVWNFDGFDSPPQCRPVSCGQPSMPENCHMTNLTSRVFGGMAEFECTTGYRLEGSSQILCQADATWGPDTPTCQEITCDEPSPSLNGFIVNFNDQRAEGFTYNTVIQYGCLEGFQPVGSTVATCKLDGQWTKGPPVCERALCVPLFVDRSTTMLSPEGPHRVSDTVTLVCKDGFWFPSSDAVTMATCMKATLWEPNEVMSCVDRDECAEGTHNCVGDTQICRNLAGSFVCECKEGYEPGRAATNNGCVDVDECSNSILNRCNQHCTNIDGGYTCDCDIGYALYIENGTNGFFLPMGETGHNPLDTFIIGRTCVSMVCPVSLDLSPCFTSYPPEAIQRESGFVIPYNTSVTIVPVPGYIVAGENILTCLAGGFLDASRPLCIAATCNTPEDIDHGSWMSSETGSYGYQSTVQYSCDEGYFLIGPGLRICQKVTDIWYDWSGLLPICTVDCGDLVSPGNGHVQYDGTTEGHDAIYSCDIGYHLFGSALRVCQLNGTWSGDIAHCQLRSCDNPGTPAKGQQHASLSYFLGSVVHFTCNDPGFMPFPHDHIECMMDGFTTANRRRRSPSRKRCPPGACVQTRMKRQNDEPYWSGPLPECVDVEPPQLFCPPTRTVLTSNTAESVTYDPVNATDNVGVQSIMYSPTEDELTAVPTLTFVTVTATARDAADNSASCSFHIDVQAEDCPQWSLGVPDERLSCTSLFEGPSQAGYSCSVTCPPNTDFVQPLPEPDGSYTCKFGVGWLPHNRVPQCVSMEKSTCQREVEGVFNAVTPATQASCYELYSSFLKNFFMNKANSDFGPLCSSEVWTASELSISMKLTVAANKMSITVGVLLSIKAVGDVASDTIQECLESTSDHVINDVTSLTVEIANTTCPNLVLNSNGFQEKPNQSETSCRCMPGYAMRNDHCLKCPAGTNERSDACIDCSVGTYQDEDGKTSCKRCPENHSTLEERSTSIDKCLELCPPGSYSSTGMMPCNTCPADTISVQYGKRLCQSCPEGSHSNPGSHQCLEICSAGSYSSTGLEPCMPCDFDSYQDSSQATGCIECADNELTEQKGSQSPGDCKDACANFPCANGGTCMAFSHTWHCQCPDNYFGVRCENAYSCANSNPCSNGGTCVQTEHSYFCECQSDYYGDACEIELTPCSSNPCANGGMCFVADGIPGDFLCECQPDYTGEYCEVKINDCASNPCNNGLCIDMGYQSVMCFCFFGWTGDFCQINQNSCEPNPCVNGGTCTGPPSSCQCPPGYTGSACQIDEDDCQGVVCQNGGTCHDGVNEFSCECPLGWMGVFCDVADTDPCDPNFCVNGDCVAVEDPSVCLCPGYECLCNPGFVGPLCQLEVDECSSSPCHNGGTCEDQVNAFTCSCPEGFVGATCDELYDYCGNEQEFCKNGATCINVIGGHQCSCVNGWTGIDCTTSINDCVGNPCENGGTCVDGHNEFVCNCMTGYEGPTCSEDTDECVPSLGTCQNEGVCVNSVGSYQCHCVTGFEGINCETNIDECENNPCQNGALCVDGINEYSCDCTAFYEGFDCEKEKSEEFDLYFCVSDGAMSSTDVLDFAKTEFTLMFWIRYAFQLSGGEPFQLMTSDNGVTFDLLVSLPSSDEFFVVQDTQWHHIAMTWSTSTGTAKWYIDGIAVLDSSLNISPGASTPSFVQVVLGRPYQSTDNTQAFHGEISQFTVFDTALDTTSVSQASDSCNYGTGQVVRWLDFLAYLTGCVHEVDVSLCGNNEKCPPSVFYEGSACPQNTIDSEPPKLVPGTCPDMVQAIDPDNRLVQVIYTQPEFTDNINITDYFCTVPSGTVLSYGLYAASCIAFDADQNRAECNFVVYVLPHGCSNPAAPVQGSKTCGVWQYGQFCNIACNEGYYFTSQPAPFYVCGREGVWDPRNPDEIFSFPGCADAETPGVSVTGTISYTVAACSSDGPNQELVDAFKEKINNLNGALNFEVCGAIVCDFTNIQVTCGSTGRRRKRSDVATIDFTFNAESEQVNDQDVGEILDEAVYSGDLDTAEGQADYGSFQYRVIVQCSPGMVKYNDLCVYCPPGEYHDTQSDTCQKCPIGQYQDKKGQTECLSCPDGTTTQGKGVISNTKCLEMCAAGQYNVNNVCTSCPVGMYQDQEGKFNCKACPNGKSTESVGAVSLSDCKEVCLEAGKYLGLSGLCELCPRGTYGIEGESGCRQCPYRTTTSRQGSVSETDCKEDPCEDFCFNDGECSTGESGAPQCDCKADTFGDQCERHAITNNAEEPGLIAGIVVGAGGSVLVILLIVVVFRKCAKRSSMKRVQQETPVTESFILSRRLSIFQGKRQELGEPTPTVVDT
ncbi:uncharacterized protein [Ptychodera flava]|uniref:uncharacterized protein n=1 Tax=Ptychodera flava TaxID=63121 RepID=UPI00396A2D81